jgi:hypothetical protein
MKKAIAILAAGLVSFGIASTANAKKSYHLSPESTSFTGSGSTSATKSGVTLACNAKFEGSVDSNGVGSITGGSFTGQLGCTSVALTGLPWAVTATGATKVVISGVSFSSPIGNCGPTDVKAKLADGKLKFTNAALAGSCTISGKIRTKPEVSIVP